MQVGRGFEEYLNFPSRKSDSQVALAREKKGLRDGKVMNRVFLFS
jgi:hypothetical protein